MNPRSTLGSLALALAMPSLQAAITDQLVVHMPFDSNLQDASGKGHHGTAVGTPGFG